MEATQPKVCAFKSHLGPLCSLWMVQWKSCGLHGVAVNAAPSLCIRTGSMEGLCSALMGVPHYACGWKVRSGLVPWMGSVWQLSIDGCATFTCGWMVRSGIGSMDGQGLATWLVHAVIPMQMKGPHGDWSDGRTMHAVEETARGLVWWNYFAWDVLHYACWPISEGAFDRCCRHYFLCRSTLYMITQLQNSVPSGLQ